MDNLGDKYFIEPAAPVSLKFWVDSGWLEGAIFMGFIRDKEDSNVASSEELPMISCARTSTRNPKPRRIKYSSLSWIPSSRILFA